MGLIWAMAMAVAGLVAYGAILRRWFNVTTTEDEIHFCETEDGWRLALSRYLPEGEPHNHPVVLCHGLGANRTTFDLTQEISLARFLATKGFDTWVLDLRGHGYSETPSWFNDRRYGWSFDDYVNHDMPTAIETILDKTGASQVHWLGHSMGGVLLYSYLATNNGERLCSGITIGSSLDYSRSASQFYKLLKFRWLLRPFRAAPYSIPMLLTSPLAGRLDGGPESFLYDTENMPSAAARRLFVNTCQTISVPVLLQLASAFQTGGIRSLEDDAAPYLESLGETQVPVLGVVGDRDLQCPLEAARIPIEAMEDNGSELMCFGREDGHQTHYGHFDLLTGHHAPDEVFPFLLEWLVEHDGQRDEE